MPHANNERNNGRVPMSVRRSTFSAWFPASCSSLRKCEGMSMWVPALMPGRGRAVKGCGHACTHARGGSCAEAIAQA
eukprot:350203-Chlamydomonas_euryale.AAC.6